MGDIVDIIGIFGSLYIFSKNTWNVKRDLETTLFLYANLDGNQRRPTLEKIYHTDRFSWKRPSLWAA